MRTLLLIPWPCEVDERSNRLYGSLYNCFDSHSQTFVLALDEEGLEPDIGNEVVDLDLHTGDDLVECVEIHVFACWCIGDLLGRIFGLGAMGERRHAVAKLRFEEHEDTVETLAG